MIAIVHHHVDHSPLMALAVMGLLVAVMVLPGVLMAVRDMRQR